MHTVFLADDDLLALSRLETLINWQRNGYEIVGRAMDGVECLQQVCRLQPDILVLDIDMPQLSGIEVCKTLNETKISTKVIILSNYDTFGFVRDAMRLGANNYLLKHQLTPNNLLMELDELRLKLDAEGQNRMQTHYFATVAKQQYLHSVISFGAVDEDIHRHMLTQPEFCNGLYILSVLQIPNFVLMTQFSLSSNRERLVRSVISLADNVFATLSNGLITYLELGCFCVLFHFNSEVGYRQMQQQASSTMNMLVANIQKLMGLPTRSITGSICHKLDMLSAQYDDLLTSLEHTGSSAERCNINMQERKQLSNAMSALDIAQTNQAADVICQRCAWPSGTLPQQVVAQLLEIGIQFQQMQKGLLQRPMCIYGQCGGAKRRISSL